MRKTYEVTRAYRFEASSKDEALAILASPASAQYLEFESMLELPSELEPVALSFAKEAFRQLTGHDLRVSSVQKQEPRRQS